MTPADLAAIYDACEVERAATGRLVAQLRRSGRQARRWTADAAARGWSPAFTWYRETTAAAYEFAAWALETTA